MKNEKSQNISFIKANALQLLSLIMLCFATYITVRLAPLAEGLAVTNIRVNAVETRINTVEYKIDAIYQAYLQRGIIEK